MKNGSKPKSVNPSLANNDQRFVLGKNMAKVSRECNSNMEDLEVKTKLKYFDVPEKEGWMIGPILEQFKLNSSMKT